MASFVRLALVGLLVGQFSRASGADIKEFKSKLETALHKTEEIVASIAEKWRIKEYPNFLKSVAMSHTSWEVLKVSLILFVCYAYSIICFTDIWIFIVEFSK